MQREKTLEIEGINGKITQAEDVIQAGNSGIVLRMISALAALSERPIVITGDYSIRHQRPMGALMSGLQQLGAFVESMRGDEYAPLIIRGPLRGGRAIIDGQDSQPVSALLIASLFAKAPIELEVRQAGEKPWVNLTMDWMKRLGLHCDHEGFSFYKVPCQQRYEGFKYRVPGDWSSAAFPLAAALVTGSELTLHNLDMKDCQGDRELIHVLRCMQAPLNLDPLNDAVHVEKGAKLHGIDIDVNDFIDSVPILAVLGCYAKGKTRIRNAAIARSKECNRLQAITLELKKMGATIWEEEDGLTIQESSLNGAIVSSHGDHRMAMALTIAGMGAKGVTTVLDPCCVDKTYPDFSSDFIKLGACLELKTQSSS